MVMMGGIIIRRVLQQSGFQMGLKPPTYVGRDPPPPTCTQLPATSYSRT